MSERPPTSMTSTTLFMVVVYAPLLIAFGLWVLDTWGLEQWSADRIGNFVRLVIQASKEQ